MPRKTKADGLVEALKWIVTVSSATVDISSGEERFERLYNIHEKAKAALQQFGVPYHYAARWREKLGRLVPVQGECNGVSARRRK